MVPMTILPPRSVLVGTLVRSVFLWALMRVVFMYGVGAWRFPLRVSLLLIATVAALAFVDLRTFRERTFLANLGVPRRTVAAITGLTAAVLEVLVALLLRSQAGPF